MKTDFIFLSWIRLDEKRNRRRSRIGDEPGKTPKDNILLIRNNFTYKTGHIGRITYVRGKIMRDNATPSRTKKFIVTVCLGIAIIAGVVLELPTTNTKPSTKALAIGEKSALALPSVANPTPPSDMCQSMQVLVLLDRSGSVTNEGSATVQKYKDQVKKVWHTLHNISATYGGYSSGYLLAFAGRTSDQTAPLLTKDNNKDGAINEEDLDLTNLDVLSSYDKMTQDIYFRHNEGAYYPSNQTVALGYNPKSEDTRYFTKANYTNWHESFLEATDKVATANAADALARDYSMVIIVTDGAPTVDDGANHKWDIFKKKANIDENFDGSESTPSHWQRTKSVVDALRSGYRITDSSKQFTPVQVNGILIGGGTAGATRMNNTFGAGNWSQSSDFDSTLGAQLLQIVGATCPPDPNLTSSMTATLIDPPTNVIEDSDLTYTVDIANTGTSLLDNVQVSNASAVEVPTDSNYTSSGYLAPGKKRRFRVTVHVGGGVKSTNITIPYSAKVVEDPSLMAPDQQMNLSGSLTSGLSVTLVPRPA